MIQFNMNTSAIIQSRKSL